MAGFRASSGLDSTLKSFHPDRKNKVHLNDTSAPFEIVRKSLLLSKKLLTIKSCSHRLDKKEKKSKEVRRWLVIAEKS